MRSNTARIALSVGAIAVLVVLFIVLSGGDENGDNEAGAPTQTQPTTSPAGTPEAPKPAITVIRVRDGKPVGGVKKLSYSNGERVRFRVVSDVADEIHVHGYDLKKDVSAGGSASFSFPADIEGVFEIELEGRHEQIAQLSVRPA